MTSLPHEKSREVNHASDICGEVFNTDHHGRKQKKSKSWGWQRKKAKVWLGALQDWAHHFFLGAQREKGKGNAREPCRARPAISAGVKD